MQLTQSSKFNKNYAAKIIKIEEFIKHPNPNCTRLKCCTIDGYSIATGIDTEPGIYIYFPIECAIKSTYLSSNNLFRDKEMNVDKEKSGFFEDNGRVKIIKLQGYPSEGFIMPIESIITWLDFIGIKEECLGLQIGTEFDTINGNILCTKYIPKAIKTAGQPNGAKISKKLNKGIDRVIDTQFRFHYNTTLIKKCPNVIHPDDLISITAKVHGTSGISAYVLCANNITKTSRIMVWTDNNIWNPLLRIFGGAKSHSQLIKEDYDYLWSSRSVVKNKFYNKEVTEGFYGVDVWKYADEVLRPYLQKGITLYYEIIGFLPSGGYIQKGYDYGFTVPVQGVYKYGTNFGIQIYRVTYTNPDGKVYEFSARQVQQWCNKEGLIPVQEYYYGYAKDLYSDLDINQHWNENFLQRLANDKNFFMECLSPTCNNEVPHEGIVIKIENSLSEAYKLKCIKFLEGESKSLDKGEVDIETES